MLFGDPAAAPWCHPTRKRRQDEGTGRIKKVSFIHYFLTEERDFSLFDPFQNGLFVKKKNLKKTGGVSRLLVIGSFLFTFFFQEKSPFLSTYILIVLLIHL